MCFLLGAVGLYLNSNCVTFVVTWRRAKGICVPLLEWVAMQAPTCKKSKFFRTKSIFWPIAVMICHTWRDKRFIKRHTLKLFYLQIFSTHFLLNRIKVLGCDNQHLFQWVYVMIKDLYIGGFLFESWFSILRSIRVLFWPVLTVAQINANADLLETFFVTNLTSNIRVLIGLLARNFCKIVWPLVNRNLSR